MADALIGRTLQSLVNGVSQQPAHIRLPSQGDEQVNCLSKIVDGIQRRPPVEWLATLLSTALPTGGYHTHFYDRDGSERYVILISDDDLKAFTLAGVPCTVNGALGEYLNFDSAAFQARDVFRTVTVADTTFIVNRTKTTAMDGVASAVRKTEFMLKVKAVAVAGNAYLKVGSTEITWGIGTNADVNRTAAFNAIDLALNADYTVRYINSATASSIIYVIQTAGTPVTSVTYTDTVESGGASLFWKKAQRFADLTSDAEDGFILEITGDGGDIEDNYWVQFDADEHSWIETVKPGLVNNFDELTMPHSLVRTAVNTFTYGPIAWEPRDKGDEFSAPEPSFIGSKIRELLIHKDRMILFADENVITSEAGFFFNYWITTATAVVDSDPIDVNGSSNRVAFLDWGVPFNQQLSLFSARGGVQQELQGVDGVLKPKTAFIVERAAYESSPFVGPLAVGRSIYFLADRVTATGCLEYKILNDTANADEITAHIPTYIPGLVRHFVGSDNESMLALVPEKSQNDLYIYRFHHIGPDKVQSSWSKWSLSQAVTILGMQFIGSKLFLLCYRADPKVFLQVIDLRKLTDSDLPFRIHLDSLMELTGSYNAGTDKTTWTLPFKIDSDEVWHVLLAGEAWDIEQGKDLTLTYFPGGTTLVAAGNYSGAPAMIGHEYESSYTFSPAVVEQEKGVANASLSRVQLKVWHVAFKDTAYFRITQTLRDEDVHDENYIRLEEVTEYSSLGVGMSFIGIPQLKTGTKTVLCRGDSRNVRLKLSSTAYTPFTLTSAEWEGWYSQRSQQT